MSDEQSTPEVRELSVAEAVDRRTEAKAQAKEENSTPIRPEPEDTEASPEEATTDEAPEEVSEQLEAPEEDEAQEEPVSEDDVEEATEEDPEPEEEEEPEEPVYTITQDGEQVEVTLTELKKGHLREAKFTQGMQTLAAERTVVSETQEHLTQQVEAAALIMENALTASGDQLAQFAEMDTAAWEKLQQEDPHEFGIQYGQFNLAVKKREELEHQAGQLVQYQQQQLMESNQARIVQENQRLIAAIPDMADVKEGPLLMEKIKTYAKDSLGLSQDEASTITDHRIVIALNKARLYDELKGRVEKVGAKKKSKAPSKTVKSGSVPTKSGGPSQRVTDLRAKAKRTGSVQDAVEARLAEKQERKRNAS